MAEKNKPIYAPVPARAMTDDRLSTRHWRTLAVVAAHDRLGKNGIGCWARHERLAALAGCSYQRLSQNLTELGEWGYIEREPHPLNKRLRVYKVIYTEEDRNVMRGMKNDTCPAGEASTRDSSREFSGSAPNSSPPDASKHAENGENCIRNILRETSNRSCRSKKEGPRKTEPKHAGSSSSSDVPPVDRERLSKHLCELSAYIDRNSTYKMPNHYIEKEIESLHLLSSQLDSDADSDLRQFCEDILSQLLWESQRRHGAED